MVLFLFIYFFFYLFIYLFILFLFFFALSIAAFRVTVALHCFRITPISKLLLLDSLFAILEYMFALQQQEKSIKMCQFIFSVEKFAHVTCMLDDN